MQSVPMTNGDCIARADVAALAIDDFRDFVIASVRAGARLSSMFVYPDDTRFRMLAVLAHPDRGILEIACAEVEDAYDAMTPECMQAHLFEREIAEQWGIFPRGHPGLKPVRYHHARRAGHDAWGRSDGAPIAPAVADFVPVDGEEVHEVAVGPVHAGIIEPGHFRFQCHGEKVLQLEIALGYQHRGVEKAMVGGPHRRALYWMERIAGDSTTGHAAAYCDIVEALGSFPAPARASALRGIALELERLANHTGDIGALAADIGYLPTAAYCGRIRGDLLNMTAAICGNRFGRGLLRPGGIAWDLDESECAVLYARVATALRDLTGAVELFLDSPSVLARLEGAGALTRQDALDLGLVGPALRACGIDRDTRHDFPSGIYRFTQIPVSTWGTGDVFARAILRWLEIQRSVAFVLEQLHALPEGPSQAGTRALGANRVAVAMVEGWRGEICHVALTDNAGRFAAYKVVDPSFHNWPGLAAAMRGQQISDFPLCNKSFNLSYSGHDL